MCFKDKCERISIIKITVKFAQLSANQADKRFRNKDKLS